MLGSISTRMALNRRMGSSTGRKSSKAGVTRLTPPPSTTTSTTTTRYKKNTQLLAATRLQARIRGWMIRRRMKSVWELVEERKRHQVKIQKLQKKLQRVQKERRELSKKGVVSGDMRQYWEESVLKKMDASEDDREEELTPLGHAVELLQMEHKELQVRYKMAEGVLRPLQKNVQTLMEKYEKHREAFNYHDEKRKAQDASNKELIERRKALEQKTHDLMDELNGISTKTAPLSTGPGDYNMLQGMKGIMDIMEQKCRDPDLVSDVREMIRELNIGASSNLDERILISPQKTPKQSTKKPIKQQPATRTTKQPLPKTKKKRPLRPKPS